MNTNVKDPSLMGQPYTFSDFQKKKQQEDDTLFSLKQDKELKDPTSLIRSDSQIRTLCFLQSAFPNSLKSTEIAEAIHLHRSTVSVATNVLIEMELVEKSIVPGTENHINPTLTFSLTDKHKHHVEASVNRWLTADPTLLNKPQDRSPASADSTTANPKQVDVEEVNQTSPSPELPIDNLSLIITEMALEIKSLRVRVSALESQQEEVHKQKENCDLSKAFEALGLELGGGNNA
ncbi:hypothetical protein [Moorena sp. SIO4A5]|uniref:hypothetical protein n=1 Tax=Moorena sp. SIO4A5 TaxID=2607838 RepID=UPI0013C9A2BF|nr:hypothetical protein [Moorena sp. SIO4A5]NEO24879.1 MarR family transcriptional regulator [Moorena sp. SIO4A5]